MKIDYFEMMNVRGEVVLMKCLSKVKGTVVVPDYVTVIGANAFRNCSNITKVVLPKSVHSIGDFAFLQCSKLTEIVIEGRIDEVGCSAFVGIQQKIILSADGKQLIYAVPASTTFEIPEGVEEICSSCFGYFGLLQKVKIPSSVKEIGSGAFKYAIKDELYSEDGKFLCHVDADTIEYEVKEGTETIVGGAFSECEQLKKLTLPSTLKTIQDDVFSDCTKLQEVMILDSVRRFDIGKYDLPENLKLIMSRFVYDIAVDSIRKTKEFEKEHIVITH